jgi:hypothetical protein
MKLFGRKGEKGARPHVGTEGHADGKGADRSPSHQLTLNLARAEGVAVMLAKSRAARMVEVADLLAGIYIHDWERLSHYWKDNDQEEIEAYLRLICRISPERWHFWIQLHHNQQQTGARWRKWLRKSFEGEHSPGKSLRRSAALEAVLKEAEKIAPSHEIVNGRKLPILSSECVLLCMARDSQSEISRKLVHTGMDLAALAHEAIFPKWAPRD